MASHGVLSIASFILRPESWETEELMRAIPYGMTKEGDEKIAYKRVPTNAPAYNTPNWTSTQHGSQSEKGVESIHRGYPRKQTQKFSFSSS